MVGKRANQEFAADNRAVSAVIGFILIFGILVLLLTIYQAQIVPQQNAQTEFEHFEDNKNEMIELRNAISDAGQNDFSRFADVQLGTTYQTRLFTINPPPPAGTLQTHEAPPIKIWNESEGNTEDEPELVIPTKFIEYRPGYNEINTGSIWYEHSVVYLDDGDEDSDSPIIEHQNLDSQNKLTVTALQNDFQRSGTDRVTLELYTNTSMDVGSFPDDYRILIPTRLDNTYWNDSEVIPEELRAEDSAVDSDPEFEAYDDFDDISGLNLTNRDTGDSLDINTVGIQSEPKEDGNAVRNTDTRGSDNGDNGDNGDTDIRLIGDVISQGDNNNQVRFELENQASQETTITELSIDQTETTAEYLIAGSNNPELIIDNSGQLNIGGNNGIEIGGNSEELDDDGFVFSGESISEFELIEFYDGDNLNNDEEVDMRGDELVITLTYGSGESQEFDLQVEEE